MDRTVLQVIGVALVVALVSPVVLYVLSGGLIGLVVACGPDGTVLAGGTEESTLTLSCALVETAVSTVVAVAGAAVLTLGVFLLGIADQL